MITADDSSHADHQSEESVIDFGDQVLPYGVFSTEAEPARVGVAFRDQIIDLPRLAADDGRDATPFRSDRLNPFLARGPQTWHQTRIWLQQLASEPDRLEPYLVDQRQAAMQLPIEVADYVDFYASIHHATRVGQIFRPDGDPLTPNWRHLPIGYHGRAGTVVVSDTPVHRPRGQRRAVDQTHPTVGPSARLDFEAELGWVVGAGSALGEPVDITAWQEHVFGLVLLNDWSARDLQAWEYVPLGPFLGKSFATSISAWVVPLPALAGCEVAAPSAETELVDYLAPTGPGFDLSVTVELNGVEISRCPYAAMHYTPAQFVAHLTVNGASLRTGDLLGSGTISGPDREQSGSLLELTWNGADPLPGGPTGFLADGDQVTFRATTTTGLVLGEVRGRIRGTV